MPFSNRTNLTPPPELNDPSVDAAEREIVSAAVSVYADEFAQGEPVNPGAIITAQIDAAAAADASNAIAAVGAVVLIDIGPDNACTLIAPLWAICLWLQRTGAFDSYARENGYPLRSPTTGAPHKTALWGVLTALRVRPCSPVVHPLAWALLDDDSAAAAQAQTGLQLARALDLIDLGIWTIEALCAFGRLADRSLPSWALRVVGAQVQRVNPYSGRSTQAHADRETARSVWAAVDNATRQLTQASDWGTLSAPEQDERLQTAAQPIYALRDSIRARVEMEATF